MRLIRLNPLLIIVLENDIFVRTERLWFVFPFNQLEDKLKMTTTHTSGKKFPFYNASFVFTYPSKHTETHADNGRCSAVNESKVTESSYRHNGKSQNLKKICRRVIGRKILEREHWCSCLLSQCLRTHSRS